MQIGFVFWPVFFAWSPLVLGSYIYSSRWFKTQIMIISFSICFLILTDLVLDAGTVFLGFWYWEEGGVYYGVPIINFIGWIISGFIPILLIHHFFGTSSSKPPAKIAISHLYNLLFWTSLSLVSGLFLPFLFGSVFLFLILIKERGTMYSYEIASETNSH